MEKHILLFALILLCSGFIFAQSPVEQEIKQLSMDKWQWMADKDIAKLTPLFHPQAKFVHMSGTWTTPVNSKSSKPEVYGTKRPM